MSAAAAASDRDEAVARIAREALGIETLASRGSDRLDFHDLGVGGIAEALRRAYALGRASVHVNVNE